MWSLSIIFVKSNTDSANDGEKLQHLWLLLSIIDVTNDTNDSHLLTFMAIATQWLSMQTITQSMRTIIAKSAKSD